MKTLPSPISIVNKRMPRRMKKGIVLRPILAGTLILGVFLEHGCLPGTLFVPIDAKQTCTVTGAEFKSWFESGAVTLDGVVKPANSVQFPDPPAGDNCVFYRWSENMFLWLTSPAPARYGGGGRIFNSSAFYDVSPPDANGARTFNPHVAGRPRLFELRAAQVGAQGLPVIFDKTGRMLELERPLFGPGGKQLILSESGDSVEIERITMGENRPPVFFDKGGKVIPKPRPIIRPERNRKLTVQKFMIGKALIVLDELGNVIEVEQGQAQDTGVLQAQNGSLVYYATMVNDVFAYFRTMLGTTVPAGTKFPTTQTELDQIIAFAAAAGPNAKTFPDPEALAVEVKTSWVEAAGLANLGSYITMQATIPTYDRSNPNLWTPTGQATVQLALVGMHVVGSTGSTTSAPGHPEMIWATFEHVDNTPNAAYTYINASNQSVPVPQNTAGNWLFCASNSAGPFNEMHMRFNPPNIEAVPPFTISPSNTIRWKPWGGASDVRPNPISSPATTAGSNTEIIAINNSVRLMLAGGDVRANYVMTGATWTIGGASPNGSFPGGNEVGTSRLTNSTMETYQQGTSSLFASGGANCFGCHVTNMTIVSHMFGPVKPLF